MKKRGAEATVGTIEGAVEKKRKSKDYRHRDLDTRIREERTETEVKLMQEAIKYGVNAPEPEQTGESTLKMEEIDGRLLKEVIGGRPELMEELGENVAKLHSADIIHGDLTTSNALVDEDLYLIDFGLSFRSNRVEDRAVDIHLMKQVLDSSHPEVSDEAWKNFLEGYRPENRKEILEQLEEVEQRGRYK